MVKIRKSIQISISWNCALLLSAFLVSLWLGQNSAWAQGGGERGDSGGTGGYRSYNGSPDFGFGFRFDALPGFSAECKNAYGPGSPTERAMGSSRPMFACNDGADVAKTVAEKYAGQAGRLDGYLRGYYWGFYSSLDANQNDHTEFGKAVDLFADKAQLEANFADVKNRFDAGVSKRKDEGYESGNRLGRQAALNAFRAAVDASPPYRPANTGLAPASTDLGVDNGYTAVAFVEPDADMILKDPNWRPAKWRIDRVDDGFRDNYDFDHFRFTAVWQSRGLYNPRHGFYIGDRAFDGGWNYGSRMNRFANVNNPPFSYRTTRNEIRQVQAPTPPPTVVITPVPGPAPGGVGSGGPTGPVGPIAGPGGPRPGGPGAPSTGSPPPPVRVGSGVPPGGPSTGTPPPVRVGGGVPPGGTPPVHGPGGPAVGGPVPPGTPNPDNPSGVIGGISTAPSGTNTPPTGVAGGGRPGGPGGPGTGVPGGGHGGPGSPGAGAPGTPGGHGGRGPNAETVSKIGEKPISGIDAQGNQTWEIIEEHKVDLMPYYQNGFNWSYPTFSEYFYTREFRDNIDDGQDDGVESGTLAGKTLAFYRGLESQFNKEYKTATQNSFAAGLTMGFNDGYKAVYDDYIANPKLQIDSFTFKGAVEDGILQAGESVVATFTLRNQGGVDANVSVTLEGSVEGIETRQYVVPALTTLTKTETLGRIDSRLDSHFNAHPVASVVLAVTSKDVTLRAQRNEEVLKMVELVSLTPSFDFSGGSGRVSVRVRNTSSGNTTGDVHVVLTLSSPAEQRGLPATLVGTYSPPLGSIPPGDTTAEILVPNLDPMLMIHAKYQTEYRLTMGTTSMDSRAVEVLSPPSVHMALVDYWDTLIRNGGSTGTMERSARTAQVRDEIVRINDDDLRSVSKVSGIQGARYKDGDVWDERNRGSTILGKLIAKKQSGNFDQNVLQAYHDLGSIFFVNGSSNRKPLRLLNARSFSNNEGSYGDALKKLNLKGKSY